MSTQYCSTDLRQFSVSDLRALVSIFKTGSEDNNILCEIGLFNALCASNKNIKSVIVDMVSKKWSSFTGEELILAKKAWCDLSITFSEVSKLYDRVLYKVYELILNDIQEEFNRREKDDKK